jgi:hypothetical protein
MSQGTALQAESFNLHDGLLDIDLSVIRELREAKSEPVFVPG